MESRPDRNLGLSCGVVDISHRPTQVAVEGADSWESIPPENHRILVGANCNRLLELAENRNGGSVWGNSGMQELNPRYDVCLTFGRH